MSKEFFKIAEDDRSVTEIRVWEPGDGLFCSHRTRRSKSPCTVPVAVIRRKDKRGRSRWNPEIRNSNVCELHVANVLSGAGYSVPGITTQADKAAKEAVLAKYWDEYQEEFADRVEALTSQQLSKLPEPLREAFESIEMSENSSI